MPRRPAERPAADHEAGGSAPLAGQLQAAAGGQVHVLHLADGGGDAGAAQGVLQGGQHLGFVPGLDLDQALGGKAETGEARGVKIVPPRDPDDGAS